MAKVKAGTHGGAWMSGAMAERRKGRNSGNREGATHDDGGGLAAPHLVLALALALRANCPTLLLLVLRAGAAAAAHDESLNFVHELGLQIFERGPIRLLVFVELKIERALGVVQLVVEGLVDGVR